MTKKSEKQLDKNQQNKVFEITSASNVPKIIPQFLNSKEMKDSLSITRWRF